MICRTRMVGFLLAVSLIAGCNRDSSGPGVVPTGTFTLQSINGQPLPYAYPNGSQTTVSGTFTFESGNRWTQAKQRCLVLPCSGSNITNDGGGVGTYTSSGNTLSFEEIGGLQVKFTGTLSEDGRELTLDIDHPRLGKSLEVYRK